MAIKRQRSQRETDPRCGARLLREARIGLSLRAPNLTRVLELHVEPEPFVVCEYVEGASLRKLLARRPAGSAAPFVAPVLLDALRALHALHHWRDDQGAPSYVVHQAPSANHLLVGVDGVARLIDLSHATGPAFPRWAGALRRLRASETAPEQWLDPEHVDPRCDLFILGITLWEGLTGRPLFDASGRAPFGDLTCWRARPPSEAGAQVAVFDGVCQRALAARREDRYWSAEEMAHELARAARRAGLYAGPEELARWVRSTLGYPGAGPSPRAGRERMAACGQPRATRNEPRAETLAARETLSAHGAPDVCGRPLQDRAASSVTETGRGSVLSAVSTLITPRPRSRRLSRIVFPLVLMPIVLLAAVISRGQRPPATSVPGAQTTAPAANVYNGIETRADSRERNDIVVGISGRAQDQTRGPADEQQAQARSSSSEVPTPIPLVYELRPTVEPLTRDRVSASGKAGARTGSPRVRPALGPGGEADMAHGGEVGVGHGGVSGGAKSASDAWMLPSALLRRDPLPANPY